MRTADEACDVNVGSKSLLRENAWLHLGALAIITVCVLFIRRPDQFFHPYIWVEDGTVVLASFAQRGWASLVEPVSGYFILATRLISTTAFAVSITHAPLLATIGIVLFTVAVVVAVAVAPTHLPWKFACALAVLFVPTNSEVFGVSEYAFWWAGILLLLALIWKDGQQGWRIAFIIVGGLSSPIIVPLSGLFVARAILKRTHGLSAGVAVLMAMTQAMNIFMEAPFDGTTNPAPLLTVIGKFTGFFLHPIGGDKFVVKLGVCAAIAFGVYLAIVRPLPPLYFWVLLAALILIVAITSMRVPVKVIHPILAGPRYFFYSSILTMWLILWLASRADGPVRVALVILVVAPALQILPYLTRRHAPIDWSAHIRQCASQDGQFPIPIHFAGDAMHTWKVKLSGQECRSLLARSLF